jgi:hypothetical protein
LQKRLYTVCSTVARPFFVIMTSALFTIVISMTYIVNR